MRVSRNRGPSHAGRRQYRSKAGTTAIPVGIARIENVGEVLSPPALRRERLRAALKEKKSKGPRGDALLCVAQMAPQLDAGIAEKTHFGPETSSGQGA